MFSIFPCWFDWLGDLCSFEWVMKRRGFIGGLGALLGVGPSLKGSVGSVGDGWREVVKFGAEKYRVVGGREFWFRVVEVHDRDWVGQRVGRVMISTKREDGLLWQKCLESPEWKDGDSCEAAVDSMCETVSRVIREEVDRG